MYFGASGLIIYVTGAPRAGIKFNDAQVKIKVKVKIGTFPNVRSDPACKVFPYPAQSIRVSIQQVAVKVSTLT